MRVHPRRSCAPQKLPPELVTKRHLEGALRGHHRFERYLARNGTLILKFFLNVSKEEQKKRFLGRLDEPEKNWKFSLADVGRAGALGRYMKAYEDAIRATATPQAPWYVVPADHKWFTRLAVVAAIVEAMRGLDLHFPTVPPEQVAALEEARRALETE